MSCQGGLTRPESVGGALIEAAASSPLGLMSGQFAREPGSAGSGRWGGIGSAEYAGAVPEAAGLDGARLGRGGMTVRCRSARALLIAALVSVARNGCPLSAGDTDAGGSEPPGSAAPDSEPPDSGPLENEEPPENEGGDDGDRDAAGSDDGGGGAA